LGEAEAMGYRLTIMPSLLLSTIMMACDEVLKRVMATDAPPSSAGVPSVRERFQRWGADEWDALRTRFRDPGGPRRRRSKSAHPRIRAPAALMIAA
jgi:hypothetical protein